MKSSRSVLKFLKYQKFYRYFESYQKHFNCLFTYKEYPINSIKRRIYGLIWSHHIHQKSSQIERCSIATEREPRQYDQCNQTYFF